MIIKKNYILENLNFADFNKKNILILADDYEDKKRILGLINEHFDKLAHYTPKIIADRFLFEFIDDFNEGRNISKYLKEIKDHMETYDGIEVLPEISIIILRYCEHLGLLSEEDNKKFTGKYYTKKNIELIKGYIDKINNK